MSKRRYRSGDSNTSSRSSVSPAPPDLTPVPPVDDDGKVVAAPPGAPHSNVQHCYQELTEAGRVQGYQPRKGYTMDDIDQVISKLTENDIQSTKGTPNPKHKKLKEYCRKNEKNEGLRIDMQGASEG